MNEAEKTGPVPQQLSRNQTKETFSLIFSLSNAGGVANVLAVLREVQKREQGIVRSMSSPKRELTVPASKLLWPAGGDGAAAGSDGKPTPPASPSAKQ